MKFFDLATEFLSGEWLLTRTDLPNGGTVVLLRSVMTSLLIIAMTVAFRNVVDPTRTWQFDLVELQKQIIQMLPWFGAIFAAVYVAFYSRFAAQWTYLANVYNQIKAVETVSFTCADALAEWKAGFLEDAQDLHLVRKPIFAGVIRAWSKEETVKAKFLEHTPGGEARFEELVNTVQAAFDFQASRYNETQ